MITVAVCQQLAAAAPGSGRLAAVHRVPAVLGAGVVAGPGGARAGRRHRAALRASRLPLLAAAPGRPVDGVRPQLRPLLRHLGAAPLHEPGEHQEGGRVPGRLLDPSARHGPAAALHHRPRIQVNIKPRQKLIVWQDLSQLQEKTYQKWGKKFKLPDLSDKTTFIYRNR